MWGMTDTYFHLSITIQPRWFLEEEKNTDSYLKSDEVL